MWKPIGFQDIDEYYTNVDRLKGLSSRYWFGSAYRRDIEPNIHFIFSPGIFAALEAGHAHDNVKMQTLYKKEFVLWL